MPLLLRKPYLLSFFQIRLEIRTSLIDAVKGRSQPRDGIRISCGCSCSSLTFRHGRFLLTSQQLKNRIEIGKKNITEM